MVDHERASAPRCRKSWAELRMNAGSEATSINAAKMGRVDSESFRELTKRQGSCRSYPDRPCKKSQVFLKCAALKANPPSSDYGATSWGKEIRGPAFAKASSSAEASSYAQGFGVTRRRGKKRSAVTNHCLSGVLPSVGEDQVANHSLVTGVSFTRFALKK